jgi:hypothetical protein
MLYIILFPLNGMPHSIGHIQWRHWTGLISRKEGGRGQTQYTYTANLKLLE